MNPENTSHFCPEGLTDPVLGGGKSEPRLFVTREGEDAAQATAPTSPAGEGSEVHRPGGPSMAALPGAPKKQENLGRSELSSEASNCTGRCLDTGITPACE